jgi:predicted nucleotidyltransferase
MNAHETVQLLSERMPEIRRRFGVRDLAIFGSVSACPVW